MGDTSEFHLTILNEDYLEDEHELLLRLKKISGYHHNAILHGIDEGEDIKWYAWRKDMCVLSKEYSDKVFKLMQNYNGENRVHYFRNGKMYSDMVSIVITVPEFNEDRLI